MAGAGNGLAGMRGVSGRLVDECVKRPKGLSRVLPIVIAFGGRGSGKTALLDEVHARCDGSVPVARIDFEKKAKALPRETLSELAFGLNKHCPQFGRLPFPRLWLCMLVVANLPHTAGDHQARRALDELLESSRPVQKHRDKVLALAQLVGESTGLPGWVPSTADALLQGLGWMQRRRLLNRLRHMSADWRDPSHALLDLSKRTRGDVADQRSVDLTFCEAFLADLRDAFSGGLNGVRRSANCVVLLDNVHTPSGRSFLDVLDKVRDPADPEPMVVLATSRSFVGRWTGGEQPTRTPHDVDQEWHKADPLATANHRWYCVRLGQLTEQDTSDLADAMGADGDQVGIVDLPSFAHRLTAGHPWATRHVLEIAATLPAGARHQRLRQILDLPADEHGTSLADLACRHLLQDFGNQARVDLITASAGPDTEFLSVPEVLASDLPYGKGALHNKLTEHFLLVPTTNRGTTTFALDHWLRTVLLHKLAARPDTGLTGWSAVHTRCRDYHAKQGHHVAALYHELALGNLAEVVAHLGQPFHSLDTRLDYDSARAWLGELDVITSAPNRLRRDAEPWALVDELITPLTPIGPSGMTVPRLIAALWIFTDPLGDPAGTLGHTIASAFDDLAQHMGQGASLFFGRAERYPR